MPTTTEPTTRPDTKEAPNKTSEDEKTISPFKTPIPDGHPDPNPKA